MTVVLVPWSWERIEDLDPYFLSKKSWFFSPFLMGNVLDLSDSLMKGGSNYLLGTGPIAVGLVAASIPATVISLRSRSVRVHAAVATIFFLWQLFALFDAFSSLLVRQ